MPWITTTGRPSGRFYPIDMGDEEFLLNGFACEGEIRSFTICCPSCGTSPEIRTRDARPRVFDRRKQRFQCWRCRFPARVRITIDCGFAENEPESGAAR
jgi:hypothetical protein